MTEARGCGGPGEAVLERLNRRSDLPCHFTAPANLPVDPKPPKQSRVDELVGHLDQHAEIVTRAAADGPEQIPIASGAGYDHGAVREHNQSLVYTVAIHAVELRG